MRVMLSGRVKLLVSQHLPSLQDSLLKEELETSQPLVIDTTPVVEVTPNREQLAGDRGECVCVEVSE